MMQVEITDEEYRDMVGYLNDLSKGEFGYASGDERWYLRSYTPGFAGTEKEFAKGMDKLDAALIAHSLNHLRTLLMRAEASKTQAASDPSTATNREDDV
jgi:hypothetical protein